MKFRRFTQKNNCQFQNWHDVTYVSTKKAYWIYILLLIFILICFSDKGIYTDDYRFFSLVKSTLKKKIEERKTYYSSFFIRGKSFLELWVTTFLSDWQPPKIFVRLISNFLCMCSSSMASTHVILKWFASRRKHKLR